MSLTELFGYAAVGFLSAEQFLQSNPHFHKASCLITDVQMPGLSGLDLQDCLVVSGSFLPVIVVGRVFIRDSLAAGTEGWSDRLPWKAVPSRMSGQIP